MIFLRYATIERICLGSELIDNLGAALDDFINNIGVVLDVVERDEEYGLYVLDRVDSLLPSLLLGISQNLHHLHQLI